MTKHLSKYFFLRYYTFVSFISSYAETLNGHKVNFRGWTNVLDTQSHAIMPLNFFLWRFVKECLQKFHEWHCKFAVASASKHATARGSFREVSNSKMYVIGRYVHCHVPILCASFCGTSYLICNFILPPRKVLIWWCHMFVSCNWVDTRWQQYSTHLHTDGT